jgi:hypothetical protein
MPAEILTKKVTGWQPFAKLRAQSHASSIGVMAVYPEHSEGGFAAG